MRSTPRGVLVDAVGFPIFFRFFCSPSAGAVLTAAGPATYINDGNICCKRMRSQTGGRTHNQVEPPYFLTRLSDEPSEEEGTGGGRTQGLGSSIDKVDSDGRGGMGVAVVCDGSAAAAPAPCPSASAFALLLVFAVILSVHD